MISARTTTTHAIETGSLTISIDGPAGSGKSTVGKALAQRLGCPYLDTGLMYRAVTWMALRNSVPVDDAAALARLACSIDFTLGGPGEGLVIDGIPAPDVLRSAEVDAAVSRVSLHPEVRSLMVERQRAMSRAGCVVMIGRDIGSVVLPAARVKLWIIASPEERARRRLAEGLPGSDGMSLREVTAQIVERDKVDSTRATSPLVKPDGSHDINTDTLSPDEAVQCALDFVRAATSDFGAQQAANEAGR